MIAWIGLDIWTIRLIEGLLESAPITFGLCGCRKCVTGLTRLFLLSLSLAYFPSLSLCPLPPISLIAFCVQWGIANGWTLSLCLFSLHLILAAAFCPFTATFYSTHSQEPKVISDSQLCYTSSVEKNGPFALLQASIHKRMCTLECTFHKSSQLCKHLHTTFLHNRTNGTLECIPFYPHQPVYHLYGQNMTLHCLQSPGTLPLMPFCSFVQEGLTDRDTRSRRHCQLVRVIRFPCCWYPHSWFCTYLPLEPKMWPSGPAKRMPWPSSFWEMLQGRDRANKTFLLLGQNFSL